MREASGDTSAKASFRASTTSWSPTSRWAVTESYESSKNGHTNCDDFEEIVLRILNSDNQYRRATWCLTTDLSNSSGSKFSSVPHGSMFDGSYCNSFSRCASSCCFRSVEKSPSNCSGVSGGGEGWRVEKMIQNPDSSFDRVRLVLV